MYVREIEPLFRGAAPTRTPTTLHGANTLRPLLPAPPGRFIWTL